MIDNGPLIGYQVTDGWTHRTTALTVRTPTPLPQSKINDCAVVLWMDQWLMNCFSPVVFYCLISLLALHYYKLCWAGSWEESLPISYLQFIIIIIMQIFSIHLITIPHLLCSFFTVIVWMLRIGLVKALWRLVRDDRTYLWALDWSFWGMLFAKCSSLLLYLTLQPMHY